MARPTAFAFSFLWLRTTIAPLAVVAYAILALAAAALAGWLTHLSFGAALVAGVLSALVFFVSEWLHQAGHALAARWVGYPMRGIHFFSVLSSSLYPEDEPYLPRALHVRRALGGFWVNLVLGLISWPLAAYLFPRGTEILPPVISVVAWLAAFSAVTNILVLGLGALLPIKLPGGGLTDGGTLLHYWREARSE